MRQRVGPTQVARMRQQTGLDIVQIYVCGGTAQRQDVWLRDGTVLHYHRDGTLQQTPWHWIAVPPQEPAC